MSVLNQSGEEQVECPLCMEPLEVDDLNFFPCTCGYQICRFCWHRIRTDENGLCPACRKAYSENPADFIPLSKEQVAQLKAEKRQRDQQRKAKLSESRKHLASVRVVQRNLVFVVGLPMRLADPEVLKKYEYFGKFGKIHKVVINQSTAYAGTQGPSASKPKTCLSQSAYVTYMKSDDALRAIQNVNNTVMDGKTIKTSLGTTKYCSHFMKNQPCPKPDCMYLHDFGDQEASFTKEQMHAGKHQEYEKKLHEALLNKLAAQSGGASTQNSTSSSSTSSGGSSTETQQKPNAKHKEGNQSSSNQQNKEGWPQLTIAEKKEREKAERERQRGKRSGRNGSGEKKSEKKSSPPPPPPPAAVPPSESKAEQPAQQKEKGKAESPVVEEKPAAVTTTTTSRSDDSVESNLAKLPLLDDNSSFFSQNSFAKIAPEGEGGDGEPSLLLQQQHNEPLLEINDTDRWAFNFGYTKHSNHLEELAKQRTTDAFEATTGFGGNGNGLEPFGQMDAYNTENLLETLAKNGVNYAQSMQAPSNGHLNGLDQHMSKFFTDFYRNGFGHQQQQAATSHLGLNGYHQHHLNLADKHTIAFLQQRQLEEQLMSLTLTKQQPYAHMNGGGGQYDVGPCQNGGGPFGTGLGASQLFGGGGNGAMSATKSRPIPEEKELDFRFQEATKALEELVESDSHVHNTGRTNIGSSQINGLVHSQSSSHLPPPPPGFVQPNTHMNSFGSKILPYLNMNNSQQQQINSTQNSWPSNFSQTQQQQQHKGFAGMGMCNDWKILDPAILSSRRHIPNMPPLLDQYASAAPTQQPQLPRSAYDGGAYNNGFSNFSPLQPQQQQQQTYGSYSQPSLNWLGGEINTQISSPPGFRTSGQATKQQEC